MRKSPRSRRRSSPFCPVGECRPQFSKEGHRWMPKIRRSVLHRRAELPHSRPINKGRSPNKKNALYQSFHNNRITAHEFQVLSCEGRRSTARVSATHCQNTAHPFATRGSAGKRDHQIAELRGTSTVRHPTPPPPSDKACALTCPVLNARNYRGLRRRISAFLKHLHGFLMRNLSF
jgi:hypothetical protein